MADDDVPVRMTVPVGMAECEGDDVPEGMTGAWEVIMEEEGESKRWKGEEENEGRVVRKRERKRKSGEGLR